MHFSILIAASISFGPLSFDLSPVAAALDRTLDTLRDRNLRMTWTKIDETDAQNQVTAINKVFDIHIHAVTKRGHYYERKSPVDPEAKPWVSCYTRDHYFSFEKIEGNWSLNGVGSPGDTKKHTQSYLAAYQGLFFFNGHTLSEYLQVQEFKAASLSLDRNRKLIWGHSPGGNRPLIAPVTFRAIVRYSDSGQLAFNEWSESLAFHSLLNCWALLASATSNVRFVSESFECTRIDLKSTQYDNCKTEEEIRDCKTAMATRSQIDISSDVDVKDEQLTTAYYGLNDATFREIIEKSRRTTPVLQTIRTTPPRKMGETYDLLIAIAIPVVLLGLLLIVIRKT